MGVPKLIPAEKLPPSNPLATAPYWGAPDGRNVTGMAAIEWAIAFFTVMEEELPCMENRSTLASLKLALIAQKDRIKRRTDQGVFGTSKKHDSYTTLHPLDDFA